MAQGFAVNADNVANSSVATVDPHYRLEFDENLLAIRNLTAPTS